MVVKNIKTIIMRIERVVQILFYLFLLVVVLGSIYNNQTLLIPKKIRNIALIFLAISMLAFTVYYYLKKNKK